jgi:hypothetical protein
VDAPILVPSGDFLPLAPGMLSLDVTYSFSVALGLELRASHLQNRRFTTWATSPVHFALIILEMGSLKLFVPASLKPWFLASQVAMCEPLTPGLFIFCSPGWP